jgi:hypothetical protein
MLKSLLALMIAASCPAAFGADDGAAEPRDYSLLSHTIAIESLRAGNHEAAGVEAYAFSVTMRALLNTPEERNLAPDKRKSVPVEIGVFGETKMDALSAWKPDDKTPDVKEIRIEGNGVRELVAKAMTELKASEDSVCVEVTIGLVQKRKKFLLLADDVALAETAYFIIPPTKFDGPSRTNAPLTIKDDKGTLVRIGVRYDKPAAPVGSGGSGSGAAPAAAK